MRWGRAPSAATQPVPERRRWARLSLAIPVFVRGINGQGREFLEFCTLLNESAGGATAGNPQTLAAPVAGIAGNAVYTRSKKCEVSKNDTNAARAGGSNHADRWVESVWSTVCSSPYLTRPTSLVPVLVSKWAQ